MFKAEVETTIKQIASMTEPGWTFKYIWFDSGKEQFAVESLPITGQAVVERCYGDATETKIECVVLDENRLYVTSDYASDGILDCENTYPIGVFPPGASNDAGEYPSAIEELKVKMREVKENRRRIKDREATR